MEKMIKILYIYLLFGYTNSQCDGETVKSPTDCYNKINQNNDKYNICCFWNETKSINTYGKCIKVLKSIYKNNLLSEVTISGKSNLSLVCDSQTSEDCYSAKPEQSTSCYSYSKFNNTKSEINTCCYNQNNNSTGECFLYGSYYRGETNQSGLYFYCSYEYIKFSRLKMYFFILILILNF
jgi:hypothetical protein